MEKLDKQAKKKILDPSKIIQSWMEGQSLLQMVSTIEKSPTKDSLTLLSNYVYGYVAEDVSWSSAAFVRLLDSHVSEGHPTQKLDREWELIPSYIRMGVSSPSALLLLTAGLGDRELANRLTRNQDLSLEANDAWIRNISWAISLDSSEYPSLEKVQSNIIHRLGPFSFLFHPTSLIEGEVNVGLDGTVTSSGTIVGLIDPPFVSILSALRKRGFTAEMRTIGHVCYLEITPSLLRSN